MRDRRRRKLGDYVARCPDAKGSRHGDETTLWQPLWGTGRLNTPMHSLQVTILNCNFTWVDPPNPYLAQPRSITAGGWGAMFCVPIWNVGTITPQGWAIVRSLRGTCGRLTICSTNFQSNLWWKLLGLASKFLWPISAAKISTTSLDTQISGGIILLEGLILCWFRHQCTRMGTLYRSHATYGAMEYAAFTGTIFFLACINAYIPMRWTSRVMANCGKTTHSCLQGSVQQILARSDYYSAAPMYGWKWRVTFYPHETWAPARLGKIEILHDRVPGECANTHAHWK